MHPTPSPAPPPRPTPPPRSPAVHELDTAANPQDNSLHFHILVRVPAEQNPTDPEMLERMETLYGKRNALAQAARGDLKRRGEIDKKLRKAMRRRMGNLSEYMTDGVALGSKAFVNEVFVLHREKFGPKRKDGARRIRGVRLKGLQVLRDLQVRAVT